MEPAFPSPFLGIEIAVVWSDQGTIEIDVRSWNGGFGGRSRIYVAAGELHALAGRIEGFPVGIGDERDFYLGAAIRFRFRCVDNPGHSVVDVWIRNEPRDVSTQGTRAHPLTQTVFMTVPIEASAVDRFVQELRTAECQREGSARLSQR